MKAYKVFNPDWTCNGFQYKVGKTYSMKEEPILCQRGFHACKKVSDCFSYYLFNPKNKVAEVSLLGIILGKDNDKQVCNKIKIVKEVKWEDILVLANTGRGNSGNRNSGDWNSGDMNSGDWNSGDWNSGDRNSGNRNSGHSNSGYSNSGDWNSGHSNSGCFNTITPNSILVFNKPCKREKWDNVEKPDFIYNINLNAWIDWGSMTDKEKADNKNAFVTGGYLKTIGYKKAWREAIDNTDKEDIELLKSLPNFDAKIFEEITGIKVK